MATTTPSKKTTKAAKEDVQSMLRIRVRAYEHKILDAIMKQIMDTAVRYDATSAWPNSASD